MKRKIILTLLAILFIPLIYINRNNYIASIFWKSNALPRISDFLEFKKGGYEIDGRTIVANKEEYGTIIVCVHKYLIVKNKEGKMCLYANKGEKH